VTEAMIEIARRFANRRPALTYVEPALAYEDVGALGSGTRPKAIERP
jgi:hypothetical protein